MSDILDFYGTLSKADIMKAYKHYLTDNEKWRKRSEGYGKNEGNGLERPKVNGVIFSWTEFNQLPKDAIIVHTFMLGIDRPYLENLVEQGFFIEPVREVRILPKESEDIPYLEWLWINNEAHATRMYPSEYGFPPCGVRGQNYWNWMDKYNPNGIHGPNWEDDSNG